MKVKIEITPLELMVRIATLSIDPVENSKELIDLQDTLEELALPKASIHLMKLKSLYYELEELQDLVYYKLNNKQEDKDFGIFLDNYLSKKYSLLKFLESLKEEYDQ